MKLGLLYETEMDVASVHERSTYVCFKHPLLQEYSGAYYIEKRLQEAPSVKVLTICLLLALLCLDFYHLQTNLRESNVFTGVCLLTGMRG